MTAALLTALVLTFEPYVSAGAAYTTPYVAVEARQRDSSEPFKFHLLPTNPIADIEAGIAVNDSVIFYMRHFSAPFTVGDRGVEQYGVRVQIKFFQFKVE